MHMSDGICFRDQLFPKNDLFRETASYVCKAWPEVKDVRATINDPLLTVVQVYTGQVTFTADHDTLSLGINRSRKQGREKLGLYRDEFAASSFGDFSEKTFSELGGEVWRVYTEYTLRWDCENDDLYPKDMPRRFRNFSYYGFVTDKKTFSRPPSP